eukprot:364783-Chlamydomonas_euryale.AAC.7
MTPQPVAGVWLRPPPPPSACTCPRFQPTPHRPGFNQPRTVPVSTNPTPSRFQPTPHRPGFNQPHTVPTRLNFIAASRTSRSCRRRSVPWSRARRWTAGTSAPWRSPVGRSTMRSCSLHCAEGLVIVLGNAPLRPSLLTHVPLRTPPNPQHQPTPAASATSVATEVANKPPAAALTALPSFSVQAERSLRDALLRDGLSPKRGYTLARYNDPTVPPAVRRNEVLIELEGFTWPPQE